MKVKNKLEKIGMEMVVTCLSGVSEKDRETSQCSQSDVREI